jgi:hypothetical protein
MPPTHITQVAVALCAEDVDADHGTSLLIVRGV